MSAPVSARFLAIWLRSLLKSSPDWVFLNRFAATWSGSLGLFVWGCKRPQSMPATYAPGPRCNAVDYTTGFWACQDLNTRYLAWTRLDPQHVGGIPVDIPGDELGTGWVEAGGRGAKPTYWTVSRRARRRVSVERSRVLPSRPISPAPVESVEALAPAPSVICTA